MLRLEEKAIIDIFKRNHLNTENKEGLILNLIQIYLDFISHPDIFTKDEQEALKKEVDRLIFNSGKEK